MNCQKCGEREAVDGGVICLDCFTQKQHDGELLRCALNLLRRVVDEGEWVSERVMYCYEPLPGEIQKFLDYSTSSERG